MSILTKNNIRPISDHKSGQNYHLDAEETHVNYFSNVILFGVQSFFIYKKIYKEKRHSSKKTERGEDR